jgi:hypothetical protein
MLLLVTAILVVEFAWMGGTQRSQEELWQVVATESGREKLWAFHVLAHRDPQGEIDVDAVSALLASPDPLLREFAMTPHLRRFGAEAIQLRALEAEDRSDVRVRSGFFFRGHGGVNLQTLKRYLRTLR